MELVPGKAAGRYRLGMSLWSFLCDVSSSDASLRIVYSRSDPCGSDILVLVEGEALLRFAGSTQTLRMVELPVPGVGLWVRSSPLVPQEGTLSFDEVYEAMGPTFPGDNDASDTECTLGYEGISFVFGMEAKVPTSPPSTYFCPVEVTIGGGGASLSVGRLGTVRLGDHVQDVMAALGPPARVFSKGRHDGAGWGHAVPASEDVLLNYLEQGFDVLTRSTRVAKFVLHTNVPGHVHFGRYGKCNFVIRSQQGGQSVEITPSSKPHGVFGYMLPRGMIARGSASANPFGACALYALPPQVVLEFTLHGALVSATVVADRAAPCR